MQPLGMRVYLAAFSMFVSSLLGRSIPCARGTKQVQGILPPCSASFSRLTPQFVPT